MKKIKYAIEIGGSYTKIFVKDEGFALCEPTLIAAQPTPQGYEIIGLGKKAKEMQGKTSESVEVFSPISNGKIINYEYLKQLLIYYFEKLNFKKNRESCLVLINCALESQERDNFLTLMYEVGFKEVVLIPTIICSLIGAGKNISSILSFSSQIFLHLIGMIGKRPLIIPAAVRSSEQNIICTFQLHPFT